MGRRVMSRARQLAGLTPLCAAAGARRAFPGHAMNLRAYHYYHSHAAALVKRYEQATFERVNAVLLEWLPPSGRALDVGAGSGRDASGMARFGLAVTAVEPVRALLDAARRIHSQANVDWHQGELPGLACLDAGVKYDFILLSAVWMHLAPAQTRATAHRLAGLLAAGGRIAVSLRSPPDTERGMYWHTPEGVARDMAQAGLERVFVDGSGDSLGRQHVSWTTQVFAWPNSVGWVSPGVTRALSTPFIPARAMKSWR